MIAIDSLNGLRCRGSVASMRPYYLKIVASYVDHDGVLWCALISTNGTTTVQRFSDLEFPASE